VVEEADEADVAEESDEAEEADEADGAEESDEADVAEESDEADEADGVAAVSLTEIKGIGPAYAERLETAGVDNVAQLAVADAEELAEATDLSPNRISGWIDQASSF